MTFLESFCKVCIPRHVWSVKSFSQCFEKDFPARGGGEIKKEKEG